MRKIFYSIALFLLAENFLPAQDWVVPDDRKGRLSTFPFSDDTRKAGERLYQVNCASCHGTPGRANYLNLVPSPGDPVADKFQKNTDGEMFYKVSTGKGQMPSFRSVLSTTDIWNLVSYLRSTNKSYKQLVAAIVTSAAYPGAEIKLAMQFLPESSMVKVTAKAEKEGSSVPVTDAGVKLYVKRYFGSLAVDEEKFTDASGTALFAIPSDLPGDSTGNINLSARFSNEELFGTTGKDTVLLAGDPFIPVSLTANRAMWNTIRKAPLWIILTFSLGLLSVWGFIFLVMMKLRDIYLVGEKFNELKEEA
jgi:mono/diheme cytochrome c family protein